ncbi:putative protein kinase RLK-Pelle-DLSV family [Helianthus annuus]|nr:putative protein kinase RLK-Pelle-DLSV family [Helianthus annuus]
MEERRMIKTKLIFSFLVFYTSVTCSFAADTISPNQIVRYNETIISPQETFELDFFSPPNSTNHYVGIWYKISKGTVVWVANRNTPLSDTSSELTLTHQGVLILRNATTGDVIWSSVNSSVTSVRNPIGQLLDTGNFIIYNDGGAVNQEDPIWQSFDFITDTFLPGMKLGRNLVTGIERNFTSWKSDNDPASGVFSNWIDTRGYPQMILTRGGEIMFRGGPWNGLRFSGTPNLILNPLYNFTFVLDRREIYYQYILASSVMIRIVLQSNGHLEILKWSDNQQEWSLYTTPQIDRCDNYKVCGPFGSCNIESSPVCMCLKGFEPTSPDQVTDIEWSKGCRHTIPLNCDPGEGFNKYTNLKLPDTQGSWYNQTMTLVECEEMCKSNCSCTAYTNSNRSGAGSGCLLWFGDLMDIRSFSTNGDTLYIRLSASELGTSGNKSGHELENSSVDEDLELPLFGLSTILKATNNFSMACVLEDGLEIAVKRLAKTSTQGVFEFKNEVISISKLQHRNLVKILGCCIEGAEKMLIYEYMQNKSLDSFIFDKTQSKLLDWPARYHIIIGIARGLLYLHQDSRFRIIHRDLKVSNILLDKDMTPKISDFGTARIFGGNQIEANTGRVVGTYGYMAPEYAGDGIFSIKSDVYSFGVLVLEIVCGEKNRGFNYKEHSNSLIGHAWEFYNEGRSMQLVAKCLGESINVFQVLRLIHVGLLCVQRYPEDRPTMTSVILMLGSESPLPSPKEPGFYVENSMLDITQSSSSYAASSKNELSITMLNGR